MHVLKTNFNGNPNVGLYGLETDKHLLLGKEVITRKDEEIEKLFNKPIKRVTIAGTSLIGVFAIWANNKLIVPHIIFEEEAEELKTLGYDIVPIETKLTCLGNNILASEKAAIANPDFKEEELKTLKEAMGIPISTQTIADTEAVGSLGVIRGNKGLFHRDIRSPIIKELEKKLGIEITLGTVNMGNPYIKSGILLGKDAFIIGNQSGGPEIINADEALGFINND